MTDQTPEHLQFETSARGFQRLPAIPGTHGGQPAGQVRIFESSSATGAYVWLEVTQPADRNHPENGETVEAMIHMRVEDAVKLADQIHFLAEYFGEEEAPDPQEFTNAMREGNARIIELLTQIRERLPELPIGTSYPAGLAPMRFRQDQL